MGIRRHHTPTTLKREKWRETVEGREGGLIDLSQAKAFPETRTRRVATKAVDFANMAGPNHDARWLLRLHRHHSFGLGALSSGRIWLFLVSCRTDAQICTNYRLWMPQTPSEDYQPASLLSLQVFAIPACIYGVHILGWRWSLVLCAGIRYSTTVQDTVNCSNCLHLQRSPNSRLS